MMSLHYWVMPMYRGAAETACDSIPVIWVDIPSHPWWRFIHRATT
jgi:hypothetical protein